MRNIRTFLAAALCSAFLPNLVPAQYRLNKFTTYNPLKASLIMEDGSSVLALQYGDTALLWRGNSQGAPLWTRRIAEPGAQVALTEGSGASVIRVDAYAPTGINNAPLQDDTASQRIRVTRIASDGSPVWSSDLTLSWIQPLEEPVSSAVLSAVSAVDGGVITAVYTGSSLPVKLHMLKHDANGNLLWCNGLSEPGAFYGMWYFGYSGATTGFLAAAADGGAFLLDHMQVGSADAGILHVNALGQPDRFVSLRYLAAVPPGANGRIAVDAQERVLLSYRAGTGTPSSFIVIKLDQTLEVLSKDIYYDYGAHYAGHGIYPNETGGALIGIVPSPNSGSAWIEVAGAGAVLSSNRSLSVPYINGQHIALKPSIARYGGASATIISPMVINHPVLGTVGYFIGSEVLELDAPTCYFEPANAQRLAVPDSLVGHVEIELPAYTDAGAVVTSASPVSVLMDITTLTGCLSTVSIDEGTASPTVMVAPNPVREGEPFVIRTNKFATMSLHDATGRVVIQGLRLVPGETRITEILVSGVYTLNFQEGNVGTASALKLVVH